MLELLYEFTRLFFLLWFIIFTVLSVLNIPQIISLLFDNTDNAER